MSVIKLREFASDPAAFQRELIIPGARGSARFGEVMAEFQRERFARLNPALLAVAKGECPPVGRFWWEATKGASKDSDLAIALLWLLAFSPRLLNCQVGAADQDQADELRKAAKSILALNPWLAKRIEVQGARIICHATGSVCEIIPADTAGSQGARPDVLVLNELSQVTRQEFAENLRDNAAKVPHGIAVIATNAGFAGTWQYRWRELARTSPRWIFEQFAKPTPWLDPDEIQEARQRNSTARFMRLFHGVWASGGGDALDDADIADAITADGPMIGSEPGYSFIAGLDLGIKRDHSALVVLGKHGDSGRVRLAACQGWAPMPGESIDLMAVQLAVLTAHKQFSLSAVRYDPYQCELMAQQLRKVGVNMVETPFVGKNLNEMASGLLNEFRSRNVSLYSDTNLTNDLGRLVIVEKSYGYKLESARDADGHTDRATAFALALLAAREMGNTRPPGVLALDFAELPTMAEVFGEKFLNELVIPWERRDIAA